MGLLLSKSKDLHLLKLGGKDRYAMLNLLVGKSREVKSFMPELFIFSINLFRFPTPLFFSPLR